MGAAGGQAGVVVNTKHHGTAQLLSHFGGQAGQAPGEGDTWARQSNSG